MLRCKTLDARDSAMPATQPLVMSSNLISRQTCLSWHLSHARQVTGSLQQRATLSQNMFCNLVIVLLAFKAYNDGLKKPQKPKTYCDNKLIRSYLSPLYF